MFNFKGFRKANNLTQKQAAEYFQCEQAFISQLESGKRPVPNDYISKIVKDNHYLMPEPVDIENPINKTKNKSKMEQRIQDLEDKVYLLNELLKAKNNEIENLKMRLGEPLNKQTG